MTRVLCIFYFQCNVFLPLGTSSATNFKFFTAKSSCQEVQLFSTATIYSLQLPHNLINLLIFEFCSSCFISVILTLILHFATEKLNKEFDICPWIFFYFQIVYLIQLRFQRTWSICLLITDEANFDASIRIVFFVSEYFSQFFKKFLF